jgi:hypothetical protein
MGKEIRLMGSAEKPRSYWDFGLFGGLVRMHELQACEIPLLWSAISSLWDSTARPIRLQTNAVASVTNGSPRAQRDAPKLPRPTPSSNEDFINQIPLPFPRLQTAKARVQNEEGEQVAGRRRCTCHVAESQRCDAGPSLHPHVHQPRSYWLPWKETSANQSQLHPDNTDRP